MTSCAYQILTDWNKNNTRAIGSTNKDSYLAVRFSPANFFLETCYFRDNSKFSVKQWNKLCESGAHATGRRMAQAFEIVACGALQYGATVTHCRLSIQNVLRNLCRVNEQIEFIFFYKMKLIFLNELVVAALNEAMPVNTEPRYAPDPTRQSSLSGRNNAVTFSWKHLTFKLVIFSTKSVFTFFNCVFLTCCLCFFLL